MPRKKCIEPDCTSKAAGKSDKCISHGGGKRCNEPNCKTGALGKTDKCAVHGGGKRCNESDCKAIARGKSDKCVAHGGGKRCNEPDCKSNAAGKSDKCVSHGGGKRCNEPNCTASAAGKTDKCVKHGGGKRCNEPGCLVSAAGKTDKCKKHGGGKRCNEHGCLTSAVGKTNKCIAHGGGKRCNEPYCVSSAQDKTDKCIAHGGGKRCSEPDCKASAIGTTDKCVAHGGGKRCPNCIDWIDSRCGRVKYNGCCGTCFKHMFPDKPVARNYKTKERDVVEYVTTKFPSLSWIADKTVNGGCSKRRPDLLLDLAYQVIIIEVDENQHIDYDCSCENKRIMELSQDLGHRPIVFIRFNPDDYVNNKKTITSCWASNKNGICIVKKSKQAEWRQRLEALENQINYWINPENKTNKTIEIIQLFYDI